MLKKIALLCLTPISLIASAPSVASAAKLPDATADKKKDCEANATPMKLSKFLYNARFKFGSPLLGLGREARSYYSREMLFEHWKSKVPGIENRLAEKPNDYICVYAWRRDIADISKGQHPQIGLHKVPHSLTIKELKTVINASRVYTQGIQTTAEEEKQLAEFPARAISADEQEKWRGTIRSRLLEDNILSSFLTLEYLIKEGIIKPIKREGSSSSCHLDCIGTND